MTEIINERIRKIAKDIESYKEAIENAEGALAEAERELDEELDKYVSTDDTIDSYPEYEKD